MDPTEQCRFQDRVEDALQNEVPETALALYLQTGASSIRKPGLEWSLVELLDQGEDDLSAVDLEAWPEDRLASASGAALCFTVMQRSLGEQSSALPQGLSRRPPLAGRRKELIVRAWLRCPSATALAEPGLRRRFARWLARHPPTIGSCLLAAAAAGDRLLVAELVPRWLSCGLLHPDAPAEVARASELTWLADSARQALRLVIAHFFNDNEALIRLLEPALILRDTESAAMLGGVLWARLSEPEQRREALAVRLAALGLAERGIDLVDEYRRRWRPTGWAYPWPERLLYLFQELGAEDLERHLLDTMEVNEKTPSWVLLMRETLESPSIRREHLEAWENLYVQHAKDERVLVGATSAVLRCPRLLRREWIERLGLRSRWQQLADLERYRWLGGAFLVLLQTEEEDRIIEYEDRLLEAPLDLPPVRRAARAYLSALRRSRQWQRLSEISAESPEMLRRACPFVERELLENLARLSKLPGNRWEEHRWCERWERLIALPLQPLEVLEVLDHFVNLRRELDQRGLPRHASSLFADVRLQLLRRSRAGAEALLRLHPGRGGEHRELRQRLARAGPEATSAILQELVNTVPRADFEHRGARNGPTSQEEAP